MASAADPALWSEADGDAPPQQWQAVASDQRWWWSSTPAPNPIMYIGDRPLPEVLEFDWEIVENPEAQMFFEYFLEGVGGETIPLGNTVGSGTIEIPTAGYVPGGEFYFALSSFYGPDAYAGTAAILGPDIPAPPVPPPPVPTCVEWGRETRAYVSGYDRT